MTYRFIFLSLLALSCLPRLAQAEGLVIKYHMMQKVVDGASAPTITQKDWTVTLYPKMVDVRADGAERVYDFGSRRFYEADLSKKTLTTYSLYAIPVSRRQEKVNRLQALFAQRKTANPSLAYADVKDVDIDTLYGSQNDTSTSDAIKTSMDGSKTSFSAADRALADFTVSDAAIPDPLKASYAHFLLYETALHPAIDKTVSSAPSVFGTLDFTTRDGSHTTETTLTFQSAQKTDTNGPDIEKFTPVFTGNDALDAAIRKSASAPMKPQQELEVKISGFLDQRDYLRAALAAKEMGLMLGDSSLQNSVPGKQALQSSDAATVALLSAVDAPPRTTEEFMQHMGKLNQAKPQAPDYTYLIELFRANQIRAVLENRPLQSADEINAMKSALDKLSAAIISNPWLTDAYCDLGDAYFNGNQVRLAWVLWEQAARLNPAYPGLRHLMGFQQQAGRDFPEYF